MELEELRDALKIASAREYALIEELLVSVSIKKSLIKQIRQTEKNDTPVEVEYYGNPKVRCPRSCEVDRARESALRQ